MLFKKNKLDQMSETIAATAKQLSIAVSIGVIDIATAKRILFEASLPGLYHSDLPLKDLKAGLKKAPQVGAELLEYYAACIFETVGEDYDPKLRHEILNGLEDIKRDAGI